MGPTWRREQILRAAERLLGRYGPAKTTIADVAREADIGVGTVYLEFPSKHAIIEELSTSRYRAMLAAMREAAAANRSTKTVRGVFDARTTCFLELLEKGAHACDLVHCMSPAVQAAQARFPKTSPRSSWSFSGQARPRASSQSRAPRPRRAQSFVHTWLLHRRGSRESRATRCARHSCMHELTLSGLLSRSP